VESDLTLGCLGGPRTESSLRRRACRRGREEVVDPIVVDQEVVDRFKHRFRVVRTIAGECILGFGDQVTDNRLDRAVVLLDAPDQTV